MKKVFIVCAAMAITTAASAQSNKASQKLPADYQKFLSRNESVSSVAWQKDAIIIKPKQGKNERYLLTTKGISEAESRYGKLPQAPPPPPKRSSFKK